MAEPSQRLDAAERRLAIVSSTMPLFAERGYAAVTTRELAEAAGVSEALLYRHFPSKEALYEAAQETCLSAGRADAQRIEALPDDTRTLVLAVLLVVRSVGGFNLDPEGRQLALKRMLLRSLLDGDDFARGFCNAAARPWVEKMGRAWEAARAAGDLHPDVPPPDLSLWLAHHLATAVSYYRLHGTPVIPLPCEGEGLLLELVRYALRGIGLTEAALRRHATADTLRGFLSART